MTSVVVFDYGFGNVRSMVRALANLDIDVTLTSDHRQALEADGLVVPGVGAFAACMEEIWGVIDNPRYLLMREKRRGRGEEYYSVPEIFGRQKERALVFEKHMRRVLGRYRVVYTRTPEGRKILLRARTRSFVNKNQSALQGRKVAKGKYE